MVSMKTELIANGLIPKEFAFYVASDYISRDDRDTVLCPECALPVQISHRQHKNCHNDHIMLKLGNSLYLWGREQEESRCIDLSIMAEERRLEEDRIAKEHGFGVLGAYIMFNHPKKVERVPKPNIVRRIKAMATTRSRSNASKNPIHR